MNQVFSFNRCLMLIAKHGAENRKKYLLGLLALMGIIMFWFGFYILMGGSHPINEGAQYGTYYFGLYLAGCLYASTVFSDLSSKSRASNYLAVPASHLEKTVTALFYGVIGFFVAYTVMFYVADFIMVKVSNAAVYARLAKTPSALAGYKPEEVTNIFGTISGFGPDSGNMLHYMLLAFFAIQSAYLLGSVYFSRFSFIKTTVALLVVWGVVIVFVAKILNSFMPEGNFYRGLNAYRLNGGDEMNERIIQLPDWVESVSVFLIKFAFAPIFWVITYFRVKEKEI